MPSAPIWDPNSPAEILDEFWSKDKSFPLGSQKSGLDTILDSHYNPPYIFEYETSNDPPWIVHKEATSLP